MPLRRDLKALFIHVPKTGGTSVEHALGMRGDWRLGDEALLFGAAATSSMPYKPMLSPFLQHLTGRELQDVLGDELDGLYAFTFVRNPFARLASVYYNPDPHLLWTCPALKEVIDAGDFLGFVERSVVFRHAHLVPQAEFLALSGGRTLDFIGRFETLGSEFARVAAQLGIEAELPFLNSGSAGRRHQDLYCDRARELVVRRYASDFEEFGYSRMLGEA